MEKLLKEGYLFIKLEQKKINDNFTKFPINIILNEQKFNNEIELDNPANFLIKDGDRIRFVVVNGFVFDLISGKNLIKNGLIIQ